MLLPLFVFCKCPDYQSSHINDKRTGLRSLWDFKDSNGNTFYNIGFQVVDVLKVINYRNANVLKGYRTPVDEIFDLLMYGSPIDYDLVEQLLEYADFNKIRNPNLGKFIKERLNHPESILIDKIKNSKMINHKYC